MKVQATCPDCRGIAKVDVSKLDPAEHEGIYCNFCGEFLEWSETSLNEKHLEEIYGHISEENKPDYNEILY